MERIHLSEFIEILVPTRDAYETRQGLKILTL